MQLDMFEETAGGTMKPRGRCPTCQYTNNDLGQATRTYDRVFKDKRSTDLELACAIRDYQDARDDFDEHYRVHVWS